MTVDMKSRDTILDLLKDIDTRLYSYQRDFRVSGIKFENEANLAFCRNCISMIVKFERHLDAIDDEAHKSNVTGE